MVWTEKQDCCHPLGSVGLGKTALMGSNELSNHTIWLIFFSSPHPLPPQNKQAIPVCFFPTGPGFGDFRLLFSNSGLSKPDKPGNLLYSHLSSDVLPSKGIPNTPLSLCVWYLAVSSVVPSGWGCSATFPCPSLSASGSFSFCYYVVILLECVVYWRRVRGI